MLTSTRVGDLKVHVVSAGRFCLDGGSMFGVVPKVLWEKHFPADELNRVTLGLNCLLVECPDGQRVLVDTGLGDRWTEDERRRLGYPAGSELAASLARLGVSADDVDVVACSHLHFDHAGGNTTLDENGQPVPTFGKARHVVQRREWQEAQDPHERHRASYRADDFLPLERAGLVDLVDGTVEIAPGVFVDHVPGHCPGMQVVRLESRGQGLVFPADLIPTAAHVKPAWNMAFDLDVVATVDAKRRLLAEVVDRGWLTCLDHDANAPLVRIECDERGGRPTYSAIPLTEETAA